MNRSRALRACVASACFECRPHGQENRIVRGHARLGSKASVFADQCGCNLAFSGSGGRKLAANQEAANQDTHYLPFESNCESLQLESTRDVMHISLDVVGLLTIAHATSSLAGHDLSIPDHWGRTIIFANPSPLTHR